MKNTSYGIDHLLVWCKFLFARPKFPILVTGRNHLVLTKANKVANYDLRSQLMRFRLYDCCFNDWSIVLSSRALPCTQTANFIYYSLRKYWQFFTRFVQLKWYKLNKMLPGNDKILYLTHFPHFLGTSFLLRLNYPYFDVQWT